MPESDLQSIVVDVVLQHVQPTVARQLVVPTTLTWAEFHEVLQIAMGWHNYHLFEFRVGALTMYAPDDELVPSETEWDATLHTLAEVQPTKGDAWHYVYDFGDDWGHQLTVVETMQEVQIPTVISGTGACPPEDVGGPPGYQMFREAYQDPDHPQHQEYRQWAPHYRSSFDTAAVNKQLQKWARG